MYFTILLSDYSEVYDILGIYDLCSIFLEPRGKLPDAILAELEPKILLRELVITFVGFIYYYYFFDFCFSYDCDYSYDGF